MLDALVTVTALAPSIPNLPGTGGSAALAAGLAVPIAGAIYVLLTWGQRSTGECSWREDDQIGIKVIVGALILVGTALFAMGLQGMLHLLTTFKEFAPRLKATLPDLLVGVAVVGGAIMFAVPKTNHAQQPKALRMFAGAIALIAAVNTVIGLNVLLKTVFTWPDWMTVADALTSLITSVVVFGGSGYLYAKMIGVEMPDIPMPAGVAQPGAQAPGQGQAHGGYAQPQAQAQAGGYAQPQAGGYPGGPAQQGGYAQQQPPQQPQQAGGYPQPGGGYPPPGGGGRPYGQ